MLRPDLTKLNPLDVNRACRALAIGNPLTARDEPLQAWQIRRGLERCVRLLQEANAIAAVVMAQPRPADFDETWTRDDPWNGGAIAYLIGTVSGMEAGHDPGDLGPEMTVPFGYSAQLLIKDLAKAPRTAHDPRPGRGMRRAAEDQP